MRTEGDTYLADTTGYWVAINLDVWGANDGAPNADVCGKTVVIQNTVTGTKYIRQRESIASD